MGDARRGSGKDKDVVDVGLPAVGETVDLDALVGGVRCCLSCHTHTHALSLSQLHVLEQEERIYTRTHAHTHTHTRTDTYT